MIAQVRAVCREVDLLERRYVQASRELDRLTRFEAARSQIRALGLPSGVAGVNRMLTVRDRRLEMERMELNG
jgi:hypothetical protein